MNMKLSGFRINDFCFKLIRKSRFNFWIIKIRLIGVLHIILGWAANYMFLGGSMVQSQARLPKSIVVIMDVGSNPTQGKFCNAIS